MGSWIHAFGASSLAATMALAGCSTSSKTSVNPNAPSAARCSVTATAQPAAVGAPGGTGSVVVSANRECAWEAASEADWLSLGSSRTGQGEGTVQYAAAGNPLVAARRGAIVVNGTRVEIGQAAAACVFAIDRPARSVEAAGGRHEIGVTAQAGCGWTANSDVPWITVAAGASGSGAGTVAVVVAANVGLQPRRGTLTIAGQLYTVDQAGATPGGGGGGGGTDPPTDPGCTYTVTPLSGSFTPAGGALEVSVTTSAQTCTWTAVSAAPWISLIGGVGETGNGGRRFVVEPNPTPDTRVGTLNVAGAAITVTQAGAPTPPTPCTFTVAPTAASVPAEGGPGQVTVTASAATCGWTATSNDGWITIQGAAGGTGSGALAFSVAAHNGTSPRTGTLRVAGTTITVTQAAAAPPPCSYTVTPNPVNVGFAGDTDVDLHVVTTNGCAWSATSQASWITVTSGASGSGDGHVHIAVAGTLSASGRTGTVLVGSQTVTVNQAGILNQDVTIEGTIENLGGACPNRTFSIGGTNVVTNAGTDYQNRTDCGDLRNGRTARVRGRGQADGSILATRIDRLEGLVGLREEE